MTCLGEEYLNCNPSTQQAITFCYKTQELFIIHNKFVYTVCVLIIFMGCRVSPAAGLGVGKSF